MKNEIKTKRNVLLHCLTNLWLLAVQRYYWRLQFHLVTINYPLKNILVCLSSLIKVYLCALLFPIWAHIILYYYKLQVLDKLVDHYLIAVCNRVWSIPYQLTLTTVQCIPKQLPSNILYINQPSRSNASSEFERTLTLKRDGWGQSS